MIPCYKSFKLVLDKLAAMSLLILLMPLWSILALVTYGYHGKVFFRQTRPGLLQRPFRLLKFMTMKEGGGADHERITPLGQWMRQYSLDELPQLWNVLKGEMSLIGPRPYLTEYLEMYSDYHQKRHWVLPGLSGWAQVHGANELAWVEKLDLDSYYVEHMSFWLDVKIFVKTVLLLTSGKRRHLPDGKFMGYHQKPV